MLQEKDRKTLFILACISIALCLAVCVPFGLKQISLFEIIFKYVVVGVFIAIVSVYAISLKFRSYRPAAKYTTIVTYTPLFSYAAAVLFSALLNLVRNGAAFGSKFVPLVLFAGAVLAAVIFLSHLYYKAVLSLSKNEAILVDVIFVLLTVVFFVLAVSVANTVKTAGTLPLASQSVLFLVVPLVLGIAAALLVVFSLKYLLETNEEYTVASREELYQQWKDNKSKRTEVYDVAHQEILESLYEFTKEQLGIEGEEGVPGAVGSTSDEEVQELRDRIEELEEEIILAPLTKALEVLLNEQAEVEKARERMDEDYKQQIDELQAIVDEYNAKLEAEEQARLAAEEEARLAAERRAAEAAEREKNKKPIEPPFEDFIAAAKAIGADRDDMEVKANDKQTQFKITSHGKNVVVLQQTKNDYKVSVNASTEEMRSILYQYNGVAAFDKTVTLPVSSYQLQVVKFSYKGDGGVEADALKDLMAKSLDALLAAEAAEDEAKAEEKARKDRAALAERTLRKQERAEERAAQKAAEQAAKEAAEAEAQQAASEEAPAESPEGEAQE